jgi:hypothetical protein
LQAGNGLRRKLAGEQFGDDESRRSALPLYC